LLEEGILETHEKSDSAGRKGCASNPKFYK